MWDAGAWDDKRRGAGPPEAAATRESLVTTWVDAALRLHSLSGVKVFGTTVSGPTVSRTCARENWCMGIYYASERRRIKNREDWGRLDRFVPGPGRALSGSARLQQ